MSWFVLMEMTLVAVMTVYLAYHTHLVFAKAKYRKIITTVIIGILIGLCLYNLIFFGFLANACICFVIFDIINLILYKTRFNRYFKFIYQRGMVALAASVILSFYGIYNAKNTVITTYDVIINKSFVDKSLMVVSDIHLGTVVTKADLTELKLLLQVGLFYLVISMMKGPPKMNLIIHYRYLKYWLVNTLFIILKEIMKLVSKVAHHLGNLILL